MVHNEGLARYCTTWQIAWWHMVEICGETHAVIEWDCVSKQDWGNQQNSTASRTTNGRGIINRGSRVWRHECILTTMTSDCSPISTTTSLSSSSICSFAWQSFRHAMSERKSFNDLPAELRNRIYDYSTPTSVKYQIIKLDKLNKNNCRTIHELASALGLKQIFPLIFASKSIMHEVLPLCLQICDVRLENLAQLDAMKAVWNLDNYFSIFMAHICTLTLDLTYEKPARYYQSLGSPRLPKPLLLRFPCASRMAIIALSRTPELIPAPSIEFTAMLEELQDYFPNTSTIRVELDATTLRLHTALQVSLACMSWPTLSEVEVRRPDLKLRLARSEQDIFGNRLRRTFWPPERIPWAIQMDGLYLETVNEDIVRVLRRQKARGAASSLWA